MAALPLDGLCDLQSNAPDQQFWLRHSPKWPLLRRVRSPHALGLLMALLKDNGGLEALLLPSLKELVLVDITFYEHVNLLLCAALKKRKKQGVPLETLALRLCFHHPRHDNGAAVVELISKNVANTLGPEDTYEIRQVSTWYPLAHGPFIEDEIFHKETYSDTNDDDD
ncbi:hypothetical protein EI94DRAFT_1747748 [Lactarius quietus]|nr:hypothetical protein EI94DRAFT_1747748 [Lactarius quietus]